MVWKKLLEAFGLPTEGDQEDLKEQLEKRMDMHHVSEERDDPINCLAFTELGTTAPPELSQWNSLEQELEQAQAELQRHNAAANECQLRCLRLREQIRATAKTVYEKRGAACISHNQRMSPLLALLGREDVRSAVISGELLGVVTLWRARSTCKALLQWCTTTLHQLPRPVVIAHLEAFVSVRREPDADRTNGERQRWVSRHPNPASGKWRKMIGAYALDLSTMQFRSGTAVPSLPSRAMFASANTLHVATTNRDGSELIVAGGSALQNLVPQSTLRWRGGKQWQVLPPMLSPRAGAAAIRLDTGDTIVLGGGTDVHIPRNNMALSSVEMLTADGTKWLQLTQMNTPRQWPAVGQLSSGNVIVAGGLTGSGSELKPSRYLRSAELYDVAANTWTPLPSMNRARYRAAGFVLTNGLFAVVGGETKQNGLARNDLELYDPTKNTWKLVSNSNLQRWRGGCMGSVLGTPFVMGKSEQSRNDQGCTVQFYDETREQWFAHAIHPYEEGLSDSQHIADWTTRGRHDIEMSGQAPTIALSTLYCHGGGMGGDRMGTDGFRINWPEYKILDGQPYSSG